MAGVFMGRTRLAGKIDWRAKRRNPGVREQLIGWTSRDFWPFKGHAKKRVMIDVLRRARPSLTDEQLDRYSRHIVLREVGGVGQAKLLAARVLVIGAGGTTPYSRTIS